MLIIGYRLFGGLGGVALALWSGAALACNVPVFRYALERWEADPYQIIVFHREPLTAEQEALLSSLENGGQDRLANLVITEVNLTQDVPPSWHRLWNAQEHPTLPWMAVRYPKPTGIERSAWTGPLRPEVVRSLVDSPARRAIAQKLLSGEAIVWLLLEGGDKQRNDEIGQLVETELRQLEKSLVLPERSPFDPPINPDLPLKIAFSTVRVARFDPAERMLVNLLLNWSTNLIAAEEPMLFPIFGRGRVIPPAVGQEIRAEAIQDMAAFLTGPCSCEVKEMNPGYDLLLAANWSTLPDYQEITLPSPPPLVGLSQFAAAVATDSPTPPRPTNVAPAVASPTPGLVRRDRLVRNLVVLLGTGVACLALASLVLRFRAGRRSR
jgi:hypothetical protein